MEYHRLKDLVARFWAGKCSEEEELELANYFEYADDYDEFKETADYFNFLNRERTTNGLDLEFDQKVLNSIGPKRNFSLTVLMRIAAGFVVLLGLYIGIRMSGDPVNPIASEADTYETPEEAYNEVKKALLLVSNKMNTSKEYGSELSKFSSAKNEILNGE